MKKLFPFLTIAAAVIILYLPIILNPSLVLSRSNDLQEFFWPIFHFVKQQILENHQFPLWNNLFLSGMPLLSDPQSPLFYPPNIIFLVLPIGVAFIVSFILHTFLAGVGMFLLCRALGIKQPSSLFAAAIYVCTPRLFGYLEAGHFGLITSFAWLPFIFLATIKIIKKPKTTWSIALALSLTATFYTHILTFLIAGFTSFVTTLIFRPKHLLFLALSAITTFGLAAITLLPQLEWLPHTTRQLLLEQREVFPQWSNAGEFLRSIFWPWGMVHELDSEKWLPLGALTIILSLFGFWNLSRKLKVIILGGGLTTLLIVLSNLSPIYSLLLRQDWFVILRVTTRIWFIPIIIVTLLAAYGLEILLKNHGTKKFTIFIATLSLLEIVVLSWIRITTPIPNTTKYAPREVYEYLIRDNEKYRVFCTNRCLSQKEAALNNLELVEGYNTLQQINYYKHAWQLTGAYWNYYTLSIPPIGTYTFEKPQPNATALGEFNTKYVISPYELTDKKFSFKDKFSEYYVYQNEAYLPRSYFQMDNQRPGAEAKILNYSPNSIKVDTPTHKSTRLVLAEVWSPGWNAYLNGKEKVSVQEKPNTLRLVDIRQNTNFVEFKYKPKSFKLGRLITTITIILIAIFSVARWKKLSIHS